MGKIVPFGKYKGQEVDSLLADVRYCMWLKRQPWLKEGWLKSVLFDREFCYMCQDSPRGMYATDGVYMKCLECGFAPIKKANPSTEVSEPKEAAQAAQP